MKLIFYLFNGGFILVEGDNGSSQHEIHIDPF